MRQLRIVVGLALVAGLFLALSTGPAGAKGKKGRHSLAGTIVSVQPGKGKNKGAGTITVRVGHRGKNGGKNNVARGQNGKRRGGRVITVRVDQTTKIERVGQGQGQQNNPALGFASLRPGEHVRIKLGRGHHAQEIDIVARGTGKRPGKNKK